MTQPTTAECIERIDKQMSSYDDISAVFKYREEYQTMAAIRAKLIAADEMEKALGLAKKTIDLIVKYPNLANNLSRSQQREDQAAIDKALTAYREAGK